MEKKTRLYLIVIFFIALANLGVLIYSSFFSKQGSYGFSISPKAVAGIKGRAIRYDDLKEFVGKFRDTLASTFPAGYQTIHTGGVRFKFNEIENYIQYLYTKSQYEGVDTSQLYVYLTPGMYTTSLAGPTPALTHRMNCILTVTIGKDIFDPANGKLTLNSSNLFGAYNWGSLEP